MERISLYLAQKSEWLVTGDEVGRDITRYKRAKKKEYDFSFRSRCKMG
jgi:hypothetical protein